MFFVYVYMTVYSGLADILQLNYKRPGRFSLVAFRLYRLGNINGLAGILHMQPDRAVLLLPVVSSIGSAAGTLPLIISGPAASV